MFGLQVEFVRGDGSTEAYTSNFDTSISGWQFLYDVFIPKKDYIKITDPKGSSFTYTYDDSHHVTKAVSATNVTYTFGSGTASVEYTYTDDHLSAITHNGFDYAFTYDGFGNNTVVQAAGSPLVSRQYEAYNGNLATVRYGNGYTYQAGSGSDADCGSVFRVKPKQ